MNLKSLRPLILTLLPLTSALGQDLPERPMLRTEIGMHSASITRIDVDAAERFLVTGSEDKTARVWDLATGKQIRVLRPPIGEEQEGTVDAVAISPDGETVAVGGWLGSAGAMSVYLFDRQTGRVSKRIAGLPEVVANLAYSPDGRFLVATLGGRNGIRLYTTRDYAQVAEDRDYGNGTLEAEFTKIAGPNSSIRLVTTSYDGFVRLYDVQPDGSMRIVAKRTVPGGKSLRGARFSPDASRIAIGFGDDARVSVLSATDLSVACSPDTRGLNRALESVAWSDDGASLFAGGRHQGPDRTTQIIRWDKGGCGSATKLPDAMNTITSMRALKGGRLIFASAYPVVSILDRQGIKSELLGPPEDPNDLQGYDPAAFYTSRDGLMVCVNPRANRPNCISLTARGLIAMNPRSDPSLSAPITTGLPITDWALSSTAPAGGAKLKGRSLGIALPYRSRCLAITPDHRRFMLGTDFDLRMYDHRGTPLWRVHSPSTTAYVNVSGDGRVAVALFADGTARWYRVRDGAQLLAARIDLVTGGRHWVLWTPSGYFDAGPGDEGLLGWHMNRGRDAAAEFYPVARFRSTYYRPDVIANVLSTLDESSAVQLANSVAGRHQRQEDVAQMLPPQIRMVSPADGSEVSSTEVTVRYSLGSPSGEPVTAVRALVDGRPVDLARRVSPISSGNQPLEMRISIPPKDSEISLIAENRFSASEPATIRLHWHGSEQFIIQPKLYILAIGVSAYPDPYKLHLAAKDAKDFVAAMQPQKGRLYRDIEAKVLTDGSATRDNVLRGFDWIQKSTTKYDVAMVFLSGHGDTEAGNYYFIPVDFDLTKLKGTAVEFSAIKNTVQSIAGKVLFFVDTCYAGGVMGSGNKGFTFDINGVANELSSAENGAVVFTATTGTELAMERAEWGNGAFTKALLDGLRGKADYPGTGTITINMLELYISQTVPVLTNKSQTPTTAKPRTIADFTIALR